MSGVYAFVDGESVRVGACDTPEYATYTNKGVKFIQPIRVHEFSKYDNFTGRPDG